MKKNRLLEDILAWRKKFYRLDLYGVKVKIYFEGKEEIGKFLEELLGKNLLQRAFSSSEVLKESENNEDQDDYSDNESQ